jgi:hypothetical protein
VRLERRVRRQLPSRRLRTRRDQLPPSNASVERAKLVIRSARQLHRQQLELPKRSLVQHLPRLHRGRVRADDRQSWHRVNPRRAVLGRQQPARAIGTRARGRARAAAQSAHNRAARVQTRPARTPARRRSARTPPQRTLADPLEPTRRRTAARARELPRRTRRRPRPRRHQRRPDRQVHARHNPQEHSQVHEVSATCPVAKATSQAC